MSNEQKQVIDARTGAVIPVNTGISRLVPPDMKSVTPVDKVAGKNPAAANLRDHPEFSGLQCTIVDAKFGTGDISGKSTAFVVIACFLHQAGSKPKEEDARVLITGSDNVYARVAQAYGQNAFPITGVLRKSGRAWFLD